PRGRPLPPPDVARVRKVPDRRRNAGVRTSSAERQLVRVLLHRPEYFEPIIERVGAENFADGELRRIFAAIVEHGPEAGPDVLAAALDGDAVVVMQELLEETGGLDHSDETVRDSLAALHKGDLVRRLAEIDTLMPLADDLQKNAFSDEKVRLIKELKQFGGGPWKQFM
ncbi:MAG: hypothetical protein JWL60_453, partial [Gemmatimonadetes bacterium]|nr:hypothetical protein [Gemmatimonadota bacterium]